MNKKTHQKKQIKSIPKLTTDEVSRLISLAAATMYMNKEIEKILFKINKQYD